MVNTNIAWDISNSGSATGTIDTFDITWGGTTDIGDLSSQAWASDPKSGNVQFTSTGTYSVTASLTDTLGNVSQKCKTEIRIVTYVNIDRVYIGTTNNGMYILLSDGTDPTTSNTGLSGNNLKFRDMKLHPAYKHLPNDAHHIWACTAAGVIKTTNGGTTWTLIPRSSMGTPENEAADGTAPTTSDIDAIGLAFDPLDINRVYVLCTKNTAPKRVWLYYTDDYGSSWANEQVSI